jgi:hypothetical protein
VGVPKDTTIGATDRSATATVAGTGGASVKRLVIDPSSAVGANRVVCTNRGVAATCDWVCGTGVNRTHSTRQSRVGGKEIDVVCQSKRV